MDVLRVTTQQVHDAMEQGERVVMLDVRSPEAWANSSTQARGAVRLPLTDFEAHARELPHDAELVAYCT